VLAADRFTYTACVVPKLTGKKLRVSKKKLKKADCKLGKVKTLKGATAKSSKVVKQSPKPGRVLAPGSKVSVKLG
jgi:beta-lactam-binding protein with PASTA domain